MNFALVLSGGGTSGVAWETGLLKGLRDGGLDLTGADLVVGTSAGAIVGAQITTGCDLDDLYERQIHPPDKPAATSPPGDFNALRKAMASVARTGGMTQAGLSQTARAQIGAMALAAEVITEEQRLAVIESYLPFRTWPVQRLLITAVHTADGEFVVWHKDSGVPLVLAVASSCAAPMVRPPTTINGRRYMDGGMRSGICADLAEGYELVIVIAVSPLAPEGLCKPGSEIAGLQAAGAHVELIMPDGESREVLFPDLLDPKRAAACSTAGLKQGLALAPSLRNALEASLNERGSRGYET
jgi:NTE family protein